MQRLIIFAPNVGTGGGLVLLRELLDVGKSGINIVAIIGSRGQAQIDASKAKAQVFWAEHNLCGRWRAERLLRRLAGPDDIVLCFHNLPPLLRNQAQIVCYVHNVFVIDDIPVGRRFSWIRFRIGLERTIATLFKRRITRYAVQTALMRDRLAEWFGDRPPPIDVLPFAPPAKNSFGLRTCAEDNEIKISAENKKWDFFYPSDGSHHKNHLRLFSSWRLLANSGNFPSLAVTLDPCQDVALLREIKESVKNSAARIVNLGRLNSSEVAEQYRNSKALIFPSVVESFGLPLVEAANLKLPILAPELDYVREVCEPSQTFDPYSSRSIAMAVLRHQGVSFDRQPPTSASEFLGSICQFDRSV
jgi:hypothetical protein